MTDPWLRREEIGDAVLYLGDCLSILPALGPVDAVVTDPPYGIGIKYNSYIDSRENLESLVNKFVPICREISQRTLIFCGQTQVYDYPRCDWMASISWNTTGSFGALGYTQWMPVLFYGKDVPGFGNVNGNVLKSDVFTISGGGSVGFARRESINHLCPKPSDVMRWATLRFSMPSDLILDPFMGSGTTGVACAQLGRRFIGIEIDPGYFEIACTRIRQAYAQGDLFRPAPKAVQMELA